MISFETDVPEMLANGTVDSRQSFALYTEAPAQVSFLGFIKSEKIFFSAFGF